MSLLFKITEQYAFKTVKILIYSDNKWVIESIEKYIDFDYELLENVDLESLNQRIDYIFVDMILEDFILN